MEFRKYQHIERFETMMTEGIENGDCYVFPKLDGTNASVYLDDNGVVKCGSRNRELTAENDNAGFDRYIQENHELYEIFFAGRPLRLYGEWLVPHTLKAYRDDTWRKFYVFDVYQDDGNGGEKPVHYNEYSKLLDEFDIEYIRPLKIVQNGSGAVFQSIAENNTFLMQPDKIGEGIVIKNYDFVNTRGNTIWAKIVRNQFKEKHTKENGAPKVTYKDTTEIKMIDKYFTKEFVDKEVAKIILDNGGWETKLIGKVLHLLFSTFIDEETANAVSFFKMPRIDFKKLKQLTTLKIKELRPDLF